MKKRLLQTMLVGLVTITTVAQTAPSRPKLVVGIVVDQLRTDYLDYLRSQLGAKGLNRLIKGGTYLRDVDFHIRPDAASATAMLFTGAYPALNGIAGETAYDPATRRMQPALFDEHAIGNFTSETLSPRPLLLSTISDELALSGIGKGEVYSVATDPLTAILMSGHAGKGAYWISSDGGKWSSSTYYKDIPNVVSKRNYSSPLPSRIDTITWQPSRATLSADKKPGVSFRYTFSHSDREAYKKFLATPRANDEVTDLAVDILGTLRLGTRSTVDMLNVGYTVAPYPYAANPSDYWPELEDAYIRLDSQIERLLDAVDKTVGLDNAVIFLSSTGYYDEPERDASKSSLPGGEFSTRRASSLLNAYLSAKFGTGEYVADLSSSALYLNHGFIEKQKADIDKVALEARDFLCRMSGVADAATYRQILDGTGAASEELRLSLSPTSTADVVLRFQPGWTVTDDLRYPVQKQMVSLAVPPSPAIIYGAGVAAREISTPVDATAIAPTVAGILRIRSPNGAASRRILP